MTSLKDIPQFISSDYEVCVPLAAVKETLERYERLYNLELNPDFQRGYVWTEPQQVAYIEFLLRGGKTARTVYFNCPKHMQGIVDTDIPQMVCVDGLQRLTAILRFMNDEITAFGATCSEYGGEDVFENDNYSINFNINHLSWRKDVLRWYIEMNSGGTVHTQEELARVQKMLNDINNGGNE